MRLKFGSSEKEQADAGEIFNAVRDGYLAREAGEPITYDADGTPVYRVLLGGLGWAKDASTTTNRRYIALDGPGRRFIVQSGAALFGVKGPKRYKGWSAETCWDGNHVIEIFPTMRQARAHCEHRARRMPWAEGAQW